MPQTTSEPFSLVRGLGLVAAISIVIGNIVGQGVFLKARIMTCNVGTPGKVIGAWIAAGLLSLAGALTYAELAAMMPRAGGEYIFVRDAYGPRLGFLYGWMQILIAKTGSQASLAVGFSIFLNILLGGILNFNLFTISFYGSDIPFGGVQLVGLGSILMLTAINCAAVSVSGFIAALLTVLKITIIIGISIGAFIFANGDWAHFAQSDTGGICEGVSAGARFGLSGFAAAMLGALWGYDGWNNLTLVAGEVSDPHRNIPRALIGGMLVIVTLYIIVNVAYFYVLTPTQVANIPAAEGSVATAVVGKFLGAGTVTIMAAALLCSTFGSLHTSILTGARVPYAMSRDGLLNERIGRVSQRTRVPVVALILQGFWAGLLTLSGTYDSLTDYVIFASWIFYGLATGSVFIFRRRMPDAVRPYRTLGYPVVPIIFLAVTAWLLVSTIITAPVKTLIGIGFIILGLPVYQILARTRRMIKIEAKG